MREELDRSLDVEITHQFHLLLGKNSKTMQVNQHRECCQAHLLSSSRQIQRSTPTPLLDHRLREDSFAGKLTVPCFHRPMTSQS